MWDIVAAGVIGGTSIGLLAWQATKLVTKAETGRIDVTVKDYDTGSPISGATVYVDTQSETTGADGCKSFTVNPGEYSISASKTGYRTGSTTSTVSGGHVVSVTLSLSSSELAEPTYKTLKVTVKGYVQFGSDIYWDVKWAKILKPLSAFKVSAEGPISRSDLTLADGTASLTLLTGTYTVKVLKDTTVLDTRSVTVDTDSEITIELPETVDVGKVTADPTYTDIGAGFSLSPYSVPRVGLSTWVHVSGGNMDDAYAAVFETDDKSVTSMNDYRVKYTYSIHSLRVWPDDRFFYVDWNAKCRAGDYHKWVVGSRTGAINLAQAHVNEIELKGTGYCGFVGEDSDYPNPVKIGGVKGEGKYLHVIIYDSQGRASMSVMPIAKE